MKTISQKISEDRTDEYGALAGLRFPAKAMIGALGLLARALNLVEPFREGFRKIYADSPPDLAILNTQDRVEKSSAPPRGAFQALPTTMR
ncbi:hypothetical protein AAFN47_10495 [Hoeflea sp. CAU 1731]